MAAKRPTTEVMLTIAPRRRSRMPGSTACAHRTGPQTLTLKTSRYNDVGHSSATALPPIPALLTSTSTTPPVSWRIRSKPAATESSSATSRVTSCTGVPAASAAAWSFPARATSRTVPYTVYPNPARCSAAARPIPEFAPVTTAMSPMAAERRRSLDVLRPPWQAGQRSVGSRSRTERRTTSDHTSASSGRGGRVRSAP